jgi:hypothetical protein
MAGAPPGSADSARSSFTALSDMYVPGKEQSEAREAIDSSRLCSPCRHRRPLRRSSVYRHARYRTRPWLTAETAVKSADHNPLLIDQATRTLENALRREGMLD